MNVADFPAGIYFIEVTHKNNAVVKQKFVKE